MSRSVVDKSSFGNAGNGMRSKWSVRSRGADPPKKESGKIGESKFSELSQSARSSRTRNGLLIAANSSKSDFTLDYSRFQLQRRDGVA